MRSGELRPALICLLGAVALSGCAVFNRTEPTPPPPPPAVAVDDTIVPLPKPPLVPTPGLTDAQRLSHAIALLEEGNAAQAKVELEAYLAVMPESAVAQRLLFQVDAPMEVLFPAEYFTVQLPAAESLSSLSGKYLGEVIGFYGLARYNGIAVPSHVVVGQSIKIPATPGALAAQAAEAQHAATPPPPAASAAPNAGLSEADIAWLDVKQMIAANRFGAAIREAESKGIMPRGSDAALLASAYASNARELQNANALHAGAQALRAGQLYLDANQPREALEMLDLAIRLTPGSTAARAMRDAARRDVVDLEYREGVEAFDANDLAGAIGHWDRALELNPDHRDSAINRAQAAELLRAQLTGTAQP